MTEKNLQEPLDKILQGSVTEKKSNTRMEK